MKVGVITLVNKNFGSALQCFSTQAYLKNRGVESEVICQEAPLNKLSSVIRYVIKYLKNPLYANVIIKKMFNRSIGESALTKESLRLIQKFNSLSLKRKFFSPRELLTVWKSEEYSYFFSGSDQVWNGGRVIDTQFYFLRFTNFEKRVAWAPSFGSNSIEKYNKHRYRKYIRQFKYLSCRELHGTRLVNELTGRSAIHLADPVDLIEPNIWREKYNKNNPTHFFEEKEDYILLFFIDCPSDFVFDKISAFIKSNPERKIFSFGYKYAHFDNLENHSHLDGDPFAFLKLIDNASIILTDSFHATIFSILFHKTFFVFERNYQYGNDQSVRVTDLLMQTALQDCYMPDAIDFSKRNVEISDSYFKKARKDYDDYVDLIFCDDHIDDVTVKQAISIPCQEKEKCVLCGLCVDVCHKKAITFKRFKNRTYPVIDEEKCIHCGLCQKNCIGVPEKSYMTSMEKEAFIGYDDCVETSKSSSGGCFYSFAQSIIKNNGVVCGATFDFSGDKIICKHIVVDNIADLQKLQGSKYLQSSTTGIYSTVKKLLISGTTVLFSGTPCQIAALHKYLGCEYDNLFTVDFVCHGVPDPNVFEDYISFLEQKYKCKIKDVLFRKHSSDMKEKSRFESYVFQFQGVKNGSKKFFSKRLHREDCAYYQMFLSNAGYKQVCYSCNYANLDRYSDVTLGDYYLPIDKMQAIDAKHVLNWTRPKSMIITHNEKGKKLLGISNIKKIDIPLETAVMDHIQLQYPSILTDKAATMNSIYQKKGFVYLQSVIHRHYVCKKLFNFFQKNTVS